jgi:DNA-binding NtrC family response regulator
MDSRFGDNGVVDRDCGMEGDDVPRRLAEDIGCAARSEMPVLITGGPEQGREIACAIDRYSRTPKGAVEVVDCRKRGAFAKAMSASPRDRAHGGNGRPSILLLQEVHALTPPEQAEFDDRLAQLRVARNGQRLRIIASSSKPLFERVLEGSFDERLYYRLAIIHMVVA